MNISKALKVKNRLAGEVKRLQGILMRENSRYSTSYSTVNCGQIITELEQAREKLISLKGSICLASAPIGVSLARLAELKSAIAFLSSLPAKDGEVQEGYGVAAVKVIWNAYLKQENIDTLVKNLQDSINSIQDDIDLFNSKTEVNFLP